MPTYRYECAKCTKVHEVFHGISEPPRKKCPDCGGRLTRLISGGGGVILKGSGFHNTDYRSKSWKNAESKSESAAKSEAAPKSDGSPKGDAPKGDAPASGTPAPKSDASARKSEAQRGKKKKD